MSKTSWFAAGLIAVAMALIYVDVSEKTGLLVQDMVVLDRSYIAALKMTSQEKLIPSRKAMARLILVWEEFENNHRGMSKIDTAWQQDMDRVNDFIASANRTVSKGDNLKNAHEELEHVRTVMMEVRVRNQIDYFVDHLTRFHVPMEAIVLSVRGKTQADLSEETIVKMQSDLHRALSLWEKVMATPFDKDVFGFTQEKAKQLEMLREKELKALVSLEQALTGSNKKQIIQSGLEIKPFFAEMFMLFGNFELNDHVS